MPTERFLRLPHTKQKRILNAAIAEFAKHSYSEVNLANIVRDAQIARGSLYQYFADKSDLYHFLINEISNRKMTYLQPTLLQDPNTTFLQLFRSLFLAGIQFAQAEPQLTRIGQLLLRDKGPFYDEVIAKGLEQAHSLYEDYIRRDQEKGLIRGDLDPALMARMISQLINSITFDDFIRLDLDYKDLLHRVDQIMLVLKNGMENDHHV